MAPQPPQWRDKKTQVVLFSSTAIALYGYDQGMMSLINTNHNYLRTMRLPPTSPLVGVIVSVYYLACAAGAPLASALADRRGRKTAILACLVAACAGNALQFVAGWGIPAAALGVMLAGRLVMGLGIGGIDAVVPVYSAELTEDNARGRALAKEFQANILGLVGAFAVNLGVTRALGKDDQWAWRIPIVVMQVFPLALLAVISLLPESPRYFLSCEREDDAQGALQSLYLDENEARKKLDTLIESRDRENDESVTYVDMLTPGHAQFHPTVVTIMGQVNQALTGYGAVSVYGPQIFELLGFGVFQAENLTMANYISYFFMMTFAWLLIDAVGRRMLMVWNSIGLTVCFSLLALLGGLSFHSFELHIPNLAVAIPGCIALFVATANFGIGWLTTVWLIPTEIYPTTARAQGTAISVIIWGFANFAVTLLTPILFNNLQYWLFLVFTVTNAFAGWWTWLYLPETGSRSFEENQKFFEDAAEVGTWRVSRVAKGKYENMPVQEDESGEEQPLLSRVRDQI